MAHIEAPDNNTNNGGLLGNETVRDFLTFMETDYHGAIGKEKSRFHIAIRAILAKKPFAMDVYKEFIETSKAYFPTYNNFVEIIDKANLSNYFIFQSQEFCYNLWGCMHH